MARSKRNASDGNPCRDRDPVADYASGTSDDAGLAKDPPTAAPPEDSLRFSFRLTPPEYRRMLYFHNFGQQRGKSLFTALAWVVSFAFLVLERAGFIPPLEKVTHGCLLLVSVLIPALLLTIEFTLYRFRGNNPHEFAEARTLAFGEDGVTFSGQGRRKKHAEAWSVFPRVYETRSMFLLYRGKRDLVILPKRAVPENLREPLRSLLREKKGDRFLRR